MRVVPRTAKRCLILSGCSVFALAASTGFTDAKTPFLFPGSLVISTSTYDNSQGAVASLTQGVTTLPGSACPESEPAAAGNDYVNVWTNDTVDPDFGVTSAITLSDINPANGQVLATVQVPTSQVVTSFSSKSELGLHFTVGASGPVLTFAGYGGAGVGALDASNSDAVAGQDPTNPVTCVFGSKYAFPRTVVSVNKTATFAYTPTVDFGGNNGRSALLGANGLYYAVGNANNGNTKNYNQGITNPDVTETTGLEAVNPLNWPTWNYLAIPPNNSAQVDPMYASVSGDKAGKDSNFRGVTEFNGALYFTKGSGSNGIDTVYTVTPGSPTVAGAPSAIVSIVNGFPTDHSKTTNGNFTPFAVFFANATTMCVADEGSGNIPVDSVQHAGLEKWSLVGTTWQLDYVLQSNLIGTQYTLTGSDGPYPTVTTAGLRNLTGVVNGNSVTLWATTSTNSLSGDPGADPNEVVTITDNLSATTLPPTEAFSVIGAATYGSVYRGVAYIND
jgi:hypothetical protein